MAQGLMDSAKENGRRRERGRKNTLSSVDWMLGKGLIDTLERHNK